MPSTFHFEIPAFCSIPLRLAVYESKTALCVNSLRLLLSFMCSKGRKVILGGQRQNNLEIKASSCHLLFSFPSFLPLMVHALCLRFHLLSSSLLSLFLLSLSTADVLVMLFCIFSPAACAGYPVWSNIPGGDLSKLPGKFVIFILNVTIFSPLFSCCCGGGGVFCCGGLSVFRNIMSVPMFRHCVTSAWNSSEGLNNRPLGLQPEPPFEETHLCSEITFIFSKYVWHKWNQFMWCSSFFPCDVCFGVNMSFSVIAADIWWLLLHMRYIDHWEKFMLGSVSVRICVNEHLWKIYQFLH